MASEGISGQLSQFPAESPVGTCTICLGKHEDRSLPNNCIHDFCFSCLLQWSKVKPECPLCVQPFSSIIHNIKSDDEYDEQRIEMVDFDYWPISEYNEPGSDDYIHHLPWGDDFTDYTDRSFEEIYNSEQLNSHFLLGASLDERRIFSMLGEELRDVTHTSSDASSQTTVTESSSEDNLSTLPITFSQQLVLSEQSLEHLDTLLLSLQSDLTASRDSALSLPPRPSRIGRVSLVIEEGEGSVVPAPTETFTGTIRGPRCEIVYRWIQDSAPPDEEEVKGQAFANTNMIDYLKYGNEISCSIRKGLKDNGTGMAFYVVREDVQENDFLPLPPSKIDEQPRPEFARIRMNLVCER